ncbi:MAG: hypothetical protein KIS76_13660 [Pyrinomonadaceae bacterium]|nr:hypothetical protein [Pyrinomonadaceae bacterium]
MNHAPQISEDSSAADRTSAVVFELTEPLWSVVTFDICAASGLVYEQAIDLMEQLDSEGVSGVCIVTNETAERMIKNQNGDSGG